MDALTPYAAALLLNVICFATLWPISLRLSDASVADLWWGPGLFAGLAFAWSLSGGAGNQRALLLLALVGLWAMRLGAALLRRHVGRHGEDARYAALRKSRAPGFWWKSLFLVFLLQSALQWIVSLTAIAGALAPPTPLGALGLSGAAIALAGLALESRADLELDRFKRAAGPGALLTSGLRAHVRHPSYTGEIAFWWGVFLIAAEAGAWWSVISPLLLTFLIVRVSGAPMTGEALARSKPGYAEWAARTPAFLPRLRL